MYRSLDPRLPDFSYLNARMMPAVAPSPQISANSAIVRELADLGQQENDFPQNQQFFLNRLETIQLQGKLL
jgi:hypothetical protein